MDIINEYVQNYRETEIPPTFARWSIIAAIAACVNRKVWLDRGLFSIRPNLYVVLVAQSGLCRKSVSIDGAERVLEGLDIMFLPHQTTTPAIVKELGDVSFKDGEEPTVNRSPPHSGMILCDELATFMSKKNYDTRLPEFLNQMWDCPKRYVSDTMKGGKVTLVEPSLCMLGGTTVDHIKTLFPENAVRGGLAGRMNYVYVRDPVGPRPKKIDVKKFRETEGKINRRLGNLLKVEGEMILEGKVSDAWEETYKALFYESDKRQGEFPQGYSERRIVHWTALSMIAALAERPSLEIEGKHLEIGLRYLRDSEQHSKVLTSLITTSQKGEGTSSILEMIQRHRSVLLSDIVKSHFNTMSQDEIENSLLSLTKAGLVKQTRLSGAEARFDSISSE